MTMPASDLNARGVPSIALEARKAQLISETKHVPAPAPRLHPKLAEIYRDKVENLNKALNEETTRPETAEALRALIDEIRLVPENGRREIERKRQLVGADFFFARRVAAALRRLAMRLRAYLIGSSSMILGSYSSNHSTASPWFGWSGSAMASSVS